MISTHPGDRPREVLKYTLVTEEDVQYLLESTTTHVIMAKCCVLLLRGESNIGCSLFELPLPVGHINSKGAEDMTCH